MRICLAFAVLTALGIATALSAPLGAAQGMPHALFGYVTDSAGNAVSAAGITILNERTGETITTSTNSYGQYQTDLTLFYDGYQTGDVLKVTAASGSMRGSAAVTVTSNAMDQCDVTVSEETPFPLSAAALAGLIFALAAIFGLSVSRKAGR